MTAEEALKRWGRTQSFVSARIKDANKYIEISHKVSIEDVAAGADAQLCLWQVRCEIQDALAFARRVDALVSLLPPRQAELIRWKYFRHTTLVVAGEHVGLSERHSIREHQAALQQLDAWIKAGR